MLDIRGIFLVLSSAGRGGTGRRWSPVNWEGDVPEGVNWEEKSLNWTVGEDRPGGVRAPYLDVRVHPVLCLSAEHPLLGGHLPLLRHGPGGTDPFAVVPHQQHPVHLAGRPGPDPGKIRHCEGEKGIGYKRRLPG